ncbi:hypothetical protein CAPTEDRAFT_51766, partial [Capitella teleta]
LIRILQNFNIGGKDFRILKNLYWQQTAFVILENELGSAAKIRKGVRQGYVLSTDLFSLYSECILRELR